MLCGLLICPSIHTASHYKLFLSDSCLLFNVHNAVRSVYPRVCMYYNMIRNTMPTGCTSGFEDVSLPQEGDQLHPALSFGHFLHEVRHNSSSAALPHLRISVVFGRRPKHRYLPPFSGARGNVEGSIFRILVPGGVRIIYRGVVNGGWRRIRDASRSGI